MAELCSQVAELNGSHLLSGNCYCGYIKKEPSAIMRALQNYYIQVQSQPWKYYKQFSVNKVTFMLSKKFSLD